jgi:hypothetical protein
MANPAAPCMVMLGSKYKWAHLSLPYERTQILPVVGVLYEPYSQLGQLRGVAAQARQPALAGTVFILCSLAGRYGYSAELA